MIKLKDLLREADWVSIPGSKGAGPRIFNYVERAEERLTKTRKLTLEKLDRQFNQEVKRLLIGKEAEGVKIIDARWIDIGEKPGIQVKLAGEPQ